MNPRFAPSTAALEICQQLIGEWRDRHCETHNVDEQVHMLASRVNSWVSGGSVVAGVRDVMSSALPQNPEMKEAIEELGIRLGRKLSEEGLLIASLRRAQGLG